MKRYIMIGAPVTSVRTPPLLEAWFASRGVEAEVETRHLDPVDLGPFMKTFRANPDLDGLLVTMPHKKTILAHLDHLTEEAAAAGSVNTVKRTATGNLIGSQFDGAGLVNALLAKRIPVTACRILLAGVGGAGMAIARAIAAHGCEHLAIIEKKHELLGRVLKTLRGNDGCPVSPADKSENQFDLLINATPLGMRPADACPFEDDLVRNAKFVADIVADPPETRLAAMAAASGKTLISGRDMVNGQIAPIGAWLLQREE